MLADQLGGTLSVGLFKVAEAHAQGVSSARAALSLLSGNTTPSGTELGIVAVLVENSLIDDRQEYTTANGKATLREQVFAYAENIQGRLPHTRSIIIGVDPNESTFKISTVLEKMYFEGVDNDLLDTSTINDDQIQEDKNSLKGVVLVGNIPVPVVYDKNGDTSPSLYPYTDFYRKQFIYNHTTDHFEQNPNAVKPTPEVWHGVIVPPSKNDQTRRKELSDFFDKNNQYSNNQNGTADFSKRMLYYNFQAVESKLNKLDLGNYNRSMEYAEEFSFRRFTRNLLKDIVSDVAADMEPDKKPEDRKPLIDDDSIENMIGSGIELVTKKFTANFATSLKTYLGRLNAVVAGTGRWSEKEVDTLASLITLRDSYMQTMLTGKSIELENLINQEINAAQDEMEVITGVTLKVQGETFNFPAYIDGERLDSPNFVSAEQCGLFRGQSRAAGMPVLENNSVRVEANRTYNPDSAIIPPEGDSTRLENRYEYNKYGGCTANNSVEVENDQANIHLGAKYCDPKAAIAPVFDVAGSVERGFEFYDSAQPKPIQSYNLDPTQCELKNISFLPATIPNGGLYAGNSEFKRVVYCDGSVFECSIANVGGILGNPDKHFHQVVNDWFTDKVKKGELVINPNDPQDQPLIGFSNERLAHLRLNRLLQELLKNGLNHQIEYYDGSGDDITVIISATKKTIKTMVRHTEPSDQTITQACSTQVTQAIPSDGIRFVEYRKNGARTSYVYPNLFRISGNNAKEITDNLLTMVKQKDTELNALIGSPKNIIANFFIKNADLTEPILWRQLGIDQKHQMILEKYLNKFSFLPVPDPNALPPVSKPTGYEVLHVAADGDENGFNFAVEGSTMSESDLSDPELVGAEEALKTKEASASSAETPTSSEEKDLFGCGGKDGVEIWEWLPNVIGCWIPNELLNLSDLVTFEGGYSSSPLPQPEKKPEDAIFDVLENSELAVENPANTPVSMEVTVDKKTLVKGENVLVKVKVLNKEGKKIIGFIPSDLTFSDPSDLVEFDRNTVSVFTGEEQVKMTTGNNPGSTSVQVKLGSLSKVVPMTVVEDIKIKLSYERETGKPSYKITANLLDSNGNPITNVNTVAGISPLNPADGKFISNTINITDGQGTAVFYPNPAGVNIRVRAQHPVYTSNPLTVPAIENDPFKVIIDAPASVQVGEIVKIPVRVADIFGVTAVGFNSTISAHVTEKFKSFGQADFDPIQITAGQGFINLKVGKKTGRINLIASADGLAPGTAKIPVTATVTAEEWAKTYPQNLFASFVGFPAADFFRENYFGGVHLFSGKTEAVFGFMENTPPGSVLTISPNYKVNSSGSGELFLTHSLSDRISLEVIDKNTLTSLLGTTLPMDFDSVGLWEDSAKAEEGMVYFGLSGDNYTVQSSGGALEVSDLQGEKIFTLSRNRLSLIDPELRLSLNAESPQQMPELVLQDDMQMEIGRLYLNYKPRTLNRADFIISPKYRFSSLYTGSSVNDPTGLRLYNPSVPIPEEKKLPENFGFESDHKYIHLFGGGSPAGEAVMWNLPINAVLLGDPSIRLSNSSASSLNYDNTVGRKIFQDSDEADIVALTNFDFNNDNIEDIAAVLKDGRIRLLEGGNTDPTYRDRGDLAFLGDGALSITAFDFNNDGYDDLLVATDEGRLAILHNDGEVITRTNQTLKIGKKLYQITKADMDADGFPDLVTLDSRGDVRIFYNENNKISENGALIGNYGFTLKPGVNLKSDLSIRFPGLTDPNAVATVASVTGAVSTSPATPAPAQSADNAFGLTLPEAPQADTAALSNFASQSASKTVSEADAKAFVDAGRQAAQESATADSSSAKLPWKEGDETETYFANLEDYEVNSAAFHSGVYFNAEKTVANKERPQAKDLDLGENLQYTITLTSSKAISDFVLSDIVPDSLSLDEKTVTCTGTGCDGMKAEKNGIYLFVGGLNLQAGKSLTITYDVAVTHTPKAAVMVKKLDANTKLDANIPFDGFRDILISPPYNNTGQLIAHYSVAPRSYKVTATKPDEDPGVSNAIDEHLSCVDELQKLSTLKVDENTKINPSFMTDVMKKCGLDKVQSDLKECKVDPSGAPTTPTPQQCAADPAACASSSLKDLASSISNFSCMGGGCFPMPFNMAFMAPKTIPFAMPLIAFPATLITPIGPLPVPSFFGVAPTPLGAAEIPGPIMSLMRLYTIPTLTGGLSIAFCWGPFPPGSPVPPPIAPIPYPPPIGNCMTFALPMSEAPQCKAIEKGITALLEAANSVVSDINSGITAVNNSGIPVELQTNDHPKGAGAGGLEVGLAVNLGKSMKFEPPAKSFSNTHLSSYDSIGGKIGGWLDRQMLEIFNKLLTLPQLRVILPDIPSLFASDWDEFNKLTTAWWNTVSGKARQQAAATKTPSPLTTVENKPASAAFLDSYKALETDLKSFNANALEDLFSVVNSIPYINLNEQAINLKIPYISYAQLQDVIRDFQDAKLYYQKQVQKYNDLIKKYQCPDPTKSTGDCIALKVLNIFVGDLTKFIDSIQKNITVLESYSKFPRDVVLMYRQVGNYMSEVAGIMENFSTMMGGWLNRIQSQIVGYVEVYYTIMEIVKNIRKLVDVFVNFENSCDICTNDRMGNFGWYMLLGLIIPEIPIIKFPKWPDLVVDLSDFKSEINIEVPIINFVSQPIKLPKIPRIAFPDLPDLTDLKLVAQIPPLPVLPSLPELPKLPPLPAVPTIKLPTLPAPPKLPDIGKDFSAIINILEILLQMWCMIKKSFSPVPEGYLGDHAVLLTNRPAYLTPLDMLQIRVSDITGPDIGFNELRVETKVFLGLRIKEAANELKKFADAVNATFPTDWSELFNNDFVNGLQDALKTVDELTDTISKTANDAVDSVSKAWEDNVQGGLNKLGTTLQEADQLFRNAEGNLQTLSDKATTAMGAGTKAANQAMVNALSDYRTWALEKDAKLAAIMSEAAASTVAQWVNAGLTGGLSKAVEAMSDYEVETWIRNQIFKNISRGFDTAFSTGEITEQQVRQFIESTAKGNDPAWVKQVAAALERALDLMGEKGLSFKEAIESPEVKAVLETPISSAPQASASELATQSTIPEDVKNQFSERLAQLTDKINEINQREPVDYRKLKEEYGVDDYKMKNTEKTIVKRVNAVVDELNRRSDEYMAVAEGADEASQAYAFIQSRLTTPEAGVVAKVEIKDPVIAAAKPASEAKETNQYLAQAGTSTPKVGAAVSTKNLSQSAGTCVGTCLIDPLTGLSVSLIPSVDNPATTVTAFIPTRIPGHSDVVYSDGASLYLKRDLSVPLNITTNIPPHVPNLIFDLDYFLTAGGHTSPYSESVNMLSTTLTENGSASFSWNEITNPDVYGVGIELERSLSGYDPNRQKNGQPDVTIILLPAELDGSTPLVKAGNTVIDYGTLVTSLTDKTAARDRFGIESKSFVTGADKILFSSVRAGTESLGIRLTENKAVYFDRLDGSGYRLNMENGFHHIRSVWFSRVGEVSNGSRSQLLSPQIYVDSQPPIDISRNQEYLFPVYKEGRISASDVLTDLSGTYAYFWDVNQDGIPEISGLEWTMPPQKEPRDFTISLIATPDITDPAFPRLEKELKIKVYAPEINLEAPPLNENGLIIGNMTPLKSSHDLTDIPFSLFRKRWGIWKNLGLFKKRKAEPTDPPLSDKNGWKDNYYTQNTVGDYQISGLTHGPSDIVITDGVPEDVAKVRQQTGQIEMLDQTYELLPLPASNELPTRISVLKKNFDTVLANVYYVADGDTDVTILGSELDQANLQKIGVTVGDAESNDKIIARNMPGSAESFPGGAAIFDDTTQKNIALISSSGAIRMMREGYKLTLKNAGKLDEKIIFRITDSNGKVLMDIFIAADMNNLKIKQDEIWKEIKVLIGRVEERIKPVFASLLAQAKPQLPKPAAPVSPFPDVKQDHPYYKQILDLYQRRIVSGYGDGSFQPDGKLTRAEFVKIAMGATNCFDCSNPSQVIKDKYGSIVPFPDVSLPAWYHYCVSIAKDLSMVTGYGDGYFRPEQNISRAEAVAVLLRQSGVELEAPPEGFFLDVPEDAWYVDYVYTGVKIGLIKEDNGFVFPDEQITRGEFAFMASGVLNLQDCRVVDTDLDGMPDWWEAGNNLDPLYAGDALLDNDDDGYTNLDEYKNNTDPNVPDSACPYADNPNKNDTDLDGIYDVCDDDIDNDGVKNTLPIYDDEGFVDLDKLKGSEDNCVFTPNADQKDTDGDGVGDACLFIDECPKIPEDLDGYHDTDGCPELNDDLKTISEGSKPAADYYGQDPGVYVNKGPLCYFLDYENDLMKGDKIMTAITDIITHDTIYTQSAEVEYD